MKAANTIQEGALSFSKGQKQTLAQANEVFVPIVYLETSWDAMLDDRKLTSAFEAAISKYPSLALPGDETYSCPEIPLYGFIKSSRHISNAKTLYKSGNKLSITQTAVSNERFIVTLVANAVYADITMLKDLSTDAFNLYYNKDINSTDNVSFSDYLLWQDVLQGKDPEAETYWKEIENVANLNPSLYLSTSYKSTEVNFSEEELKYSSPRLAELQKYCENVNCSLDTLLLLCYISLLKYFSASESFLLGLYSSERYYEEFAGLAAPLAKMLPFKFAADPSESIGLILRKLEIAKSELKGWGDYCPEDLQIPEFTYECNDEPGADSGRLKWKRAISLISQVKLQLCAGIDQDELFIRFVYNTAYFDQGSVDVLKKHFDILLQYMLEDDTQCFKSNSFYTPFSRDEFEENFNFRLGTQVPQVTKSVVRLFEEQVEKIPNHPALSYGSTSLSYLELNQKVNQLAHQLKDSYGLGRGDVAAVLLERSLEQVIAFLAILKVGAAYLPIVANQPINRQKIILSDARPKLIILESASFINGTYDFFDGGCFVIDIQLPSLSSSKENPKDQVELEDTAYVIYTSGSTGSPKGVEVTHHSLANYTLWVNETFNINSNDTSILFSSLCFDLSYTVLWPALTSGSHVILESEDATYQPDALLNTMISKKVTFVKMTPSHFNMLLNSSDFDEASSKHSLRLIVLGGEIINTNDLLRWFQKSPDTLIVNHYGPTETTVGAAAKQIIYSNDFKQFKRQPVIGKPIAGNHIFLLDEEGVMVPPGIKGEIAVAGPGVAKGYYKNPELSQSSFTTSRFGDESRLYKTGDLGVWTTNGEIIFVGRKDAQIKIRGFRVETGEIESQLRSFSGIESARVVQLDGSLVAILKGNNSEIVPDVRTFLADRLPEYMLPQNYLFLPYIPVNANGKLDLHKIKRSLQKQQQHLENYEPSQDALQENLVKIFETVLMKRPIGINDDFFQLGGDSLKSVLVVTQIHKLLQLKAEVRTIFEQPTIKLLSGVLRLGESTEYAHIPIAPSKSSFILSHGQKRMWILNEYEKGNISYNRPSSYLLRGSLNIEALEKALRFIITRHESLRTVFTVEGGEPVQQIVAVEDYDFSLPYEDLSRLENNLVHAEQLCSDLATSSFDLSTGPLMRTLLLKISEEEHVFSLVSHHITTDAWSIAIITNELFLAYNSYNQARQILMKPLRIQYKDYAAWQHAQLSLEQGQEHRKYWVEMFSEEVPVLDLPFDYSRPAYRSYRGDREIFVFGKKVLQTLTETANEENVSMYMLLTTITNFLLYKYTAQTDIVIGSPIAGRDHPDLETQVGMYLNTLPIRSRFSRTDTFQQLLQSVKQNVLNAFEHRIFPFDLLLEELQLSWDTSRTPLFDVALVFQNVQVQQETAAEGMDGVVIAPFETEFKSSAVDLRIEFTEFDDSIGMVVDYNTDIFVAERIKRFISHFGVIAESLKDIGQTPLKDIDYLPESERQLLLTNFGNLAVTQASTSCLSQVFSQTSRLNAKSTALLFQDVRMTYEELDAAANKLAVHLVQNIGVTVGDCVAVHLEKSQYFIISILAVFRSGAVYVPIDPEHPFSRKEYILHDTSAKVLITDSSSMFDFPSFVGHLMAIDLQLETLPEGNSSDIPIPEGNAIAYIIYTSGTTGTPKGVQIFHQSILRRILYCNEYLAITDKDHVLQFAAQGFDASLYEIFMALLPGGQLIIPHEAARKSIPIFLDLLQRTQVTVATLPPAFLKILGKDRLPGLKTLVSTGEAAILDDAVYHASYLNYYNGYGPTEACIGASFYKVDPTKQTYYHQINAIPIGLPFADTKIYVLDKEMKLSGLGNIGEIYIASFCLAGGYLNDPVLTATKFVANPFQKQDGYDRIYRTGDLGKWAQDGQLEFAGRRDEQVQINGIRVEPNEVTAHLLKHPDVANAAVIYIDGKGLVACAEKRKKISLWPDINTVNVFDDILYHAMSKDSLRLEAYERAFSRHLKGQTVLDVGTGKDVLLARMAVQQGAAKVYAVEINETAYQQASQLITREGLSNKITLMKGDIQTIDLPEQVDYVIHDLSGNIGGAAGASELIKSASRFLKQKEHIFPNQFLTYAAAYHLEEKQFDFGFAEVPANYVCKMFEYTGYPFDIRLCLSEVKQNNILSEREIFEDVNFLNPQPEYRTHQIKLGIKKSGLFTGLVLGLDVQVEDGLVIDNLKDGATILPAYIPLCHPGIQVSAGYEIDLSITRVVPSNSISPDFHIVGQVIANDGATQEFNFHTCNNAPVFRSNEFYKNLFPSDGKVPVIPDFTPENLKLYLRKKVPVYMIPQRVLIVDQIPLTINGKLDPGKVIEEMKAVQDPIYKPPVSETEQQLAAVFKLCLETDKLGIDDNFFEHGANSLRMIRALKLLDESYPGIFQISDLFSYPTISGLKNLLKPESVSNGQQVIEVLDF